METLKEAKKKFEKEWIAFLVKEEIPEISGKVLDHDKDKHALHKRLREKKIKYAYITYTGPYIRPGYEVLF